MSKIRRRDEGEETGEGANGETPKKSKTNEVNKPEQAKQQKKTINPFATFSVSRPAPKTPFLFQPLSPTSSSTPSTTVNTQKTQQKSLFGEIKREQERKEEEKAKGEEPDGEKEAENQSEQEQEEEEEIKEGEGQQTAEKQKMNLHEGQIYFDWTLKKQMILTSTQPFDWLQLNEANNQTNGLINFFSSFSLPSPLRSLSLPPLSSLSQKEIEVELQKHLFYFSYPSSSSLSSTSTSTSSSISPSEKSNNSKEEWRESFASLSQLILSPQKICDYFYLFHSQFVCLFLAPGIGGSEVAAAFLSHSSPGLRLRLQNAGIKFSLPLATKKELREEESMSKMEIQLDQQKTGKLHIATSIPSNLKGNNPRSLLHIFGEKNLELLQNFLCQLFLENSSLLSSSLPSMDEKNSSSTSLPLLLSSTPFLHSSLKRSKILFSGQILHADSKNSKRVQDMFKMEVLGPLLPSAYFSICKIFQHLHTEKRTDKSKKEMNITFLTEQMTGCFNCFSKQKQGTPAGATADVAFLSCSNDPALKKKFLKKITITDGHCEIQTNSIL
eukprot:TRINITY_DN8626_c0_g1_i1.p1 TRINITY_DN8626_c0_g1~~TRINITY_DN8626_c0_g1_i1.p1  ORF type:complete len:570 (+),score=175.80 TRINITY_DN8626_c0_g1_i1:51-1712(+)